MKLYTLSGSLPRELCIDHHPQSHEYHGESERERDLESSPLPFRGFKPDFPAVLVHDIFRNIQPETATVGEVQERFLGPEEFCEYPVGFRFRDSDTAVFDGHDY